MDENHLPEMLVEICNLVLKSKVWSVAGAFMFSERGGITLAIRPCCLNDAQI